VLDGYNSIIVSKVWKLECKILQSMSDMYFAVTSNLGSGKWVANEIIITRIMNIIYSHTKFYERDFVCFASGRCATGSYKSQLSALSCSVDCTSQKILFCIMDECASVYHFWFVKTLLISGRRYRTNQKSM
jgi:hypothetical protein